MHDMVPENSYTATWWIQS